MKTCKADGCNNKVHGKGYCRKHYNQMHRHGKILDRTNQEPNDIIIYEDYAEVILYNRQGEEKARTLIDVEDVDRVREYKWGFNGRYVNCGILRISLHRFIMNAPKGKLVDHINHNKLDNRKCNLRICTSSQNNMNRAKSSRNTSGNKGVCYKPKIDKWQAYITVKKQPIHLGYYNTKEEAIKVRQEAEEKYFGEYKYKKEGGDNYLQSIEESNRER